MMWLYTYMYNKATFIRLASTKAYQAVKSNIVIVGIINLILLFDKETTNTIMQLNVTVINL